MLGPVTVGLKHDMITLEPLPNRHHPQAVSCSTPSNSVIKDSKVNVFPMFSKPIRVPLKVSALCGICVLTVVFMNMESIEMIENDHFLPQCSQLPDCGGVNHHIIAILLTSSLIGCTLFGQYHGHRFNPAKSILKCLFPVVLGFAIFRHIFRVSPTPGHSAKVNGAYVLNADACTLKWKIMSKMLSSFPEGMVERVSAHRYPKQYGYIETKISILLSHMVMLEKIALREPYLEDGSKAWYLTFEDDSVTSLDHSKLYDTLNRMLSEVPSTAITVNIGPCQSREHMPDILGGGRVNCRYFGMDSSSLVSTMVSTPHLISDPSLQEQLAPTSIEPWLYRMASTCRTAWAVTPEGAKWMMEHLKHDMKDGNHLAGDGILARSAAHDFFTRDTFFIRLFGQHEWCNRYGNNTLKCRVEEVGNVTSTANNGKTSQKRSRRLKESFLLLPDSMVNETTPLSSAYHITQPKAKSTRTTETLKGDRKESENEVASSQSSKNRTRNRYVRGGYKK
jgi:hypothetical protein